MTLPMDWMLLYDVTNGLDVVYDVTDGLDVVYDVID